MKDSNDLPHSSHSFYAVYSARMNVELLCKCMKNGHETTSNKRNCTDTNTHTHAPSIQKQRTEIIKAVCFCLGHSENQTTARSKASIKQKVKIIENISMHTGPAHNGILIENGRKKRLHLKNPSAYERGLVNGFLCIEAVTDSALSISILLPMLMLFFSVCCLFICIWIESYGTKYVCI